MPITVTLWSKKPGDIKTFLESYYEKESEMDVDVDRWIYVYRKPLDAIDIISAVMDNNYRYNISMCLQVGDGDIYPITYDNHNDVIKGLLHLFYTETPDYVKCIE